MKRIAFATVLLVLLGLSAPTPAYADNGNIFNSLQANLTCQGLLGYVNETSGGTQSGPFADLYRNTNCDGKKQGSNKNDVTNDVACNALTNLGNYATDDSKRDLTAHTATGLTPAGAAQMANEITQSLAASGCAGVPPAEGAQVDTTEHIKRLVNGLEYYALMACLIAMLLSTSLWAMGSKGQNPGQELTGKRGLIVAVTAAMFIGALPGLLNYVSGKASEVDSNGVTSATFPASAPTGGSTDSHTFGSGALGNQGKSGG